ncbi:hypothetical protein [Blastococcus sp. SYSU DS0617]
MTTGADWADSARRLLDVLRPPTGAPTGSAEDSTEGGPAHGADCRWCPVCQASAVLRGERPEVTAALADVLATTASVLRDLAGEPVRSSGPASAPDAPGEGDDRGEDTAPGAGAVQRIDIA